MNVNEKVEKLENAQVMLDIAVSAADVAKEYDAIYRSFASRVKIPGFRPGKVPKDILKQRFEGNIKSDALEKILSKAIETAITKNDLIAVSSPDVQDIESLFGRLEEDKDFSFQAKIEVYPTVEIGDYKGISVSISEYYYDQEHLDHKLKELQYRMAEIEKKEDGVVESEDLITIEYNFYLVNKDSTEKHHYHVNMREEDNWFEPIKSQLMGMKVGEEKDFAMMIPVDYEEKALGGKDGNVHIKITEIQAEKLPAIDDELAKDFSFETLEELKVDIEDKLKEACAKKRRESSFEAVVQKVMDNSRFNMGDEVIERHIDHSIRSMAQQLEQLNVTLEQYLERMNQSMDSIRDSFRSQSEKEIKFELIRNSIIEKEKLEVSEDDLEKDYQNYAEYAKISFEEAKLKLKESKEIETLKRGRLYQKVVDFLINENEVQETMREAIYEVVPNKLIGS